jgi:hypothetical protein
MRRKVAALALLGALAADAHVVSMSSSELKVQDRMAAYELRMPLYEIVHVANPETALLDNVRFAEARRTSGVCREEDGIYVCRAAYEFARPVPEKLDVECRLFRVTVPNHVHLLHATQGPNGDQVVFDARFTTAEVRFRPPSAVEVFVRESSAGIARWFRSAPGLLFLVALALAARSWGEVALFAVLFVAGEWAARPLAPRVPLPLSQAFLEAAMALTSAYLAVDVLLLPKARARWAMIPFLGLVHGLSLAAFPANYLTGASAAQLVAMGIAPAAALRVPSGLRTILVAALLAGSLGWFLRLLLAPR